MKLKRFLCLLLVMVMLLANIPAEILTIRAEADSTAYMGGYSWSFDQTVTMGATKGLVAGNAAGSIQVMHHEGNNSLTPGRAIADGVLTTTVAKNWGNTVGHAVFYKLPADLVAGKSYDLTLNLYGGNDAAAMNGIAVSFGNYNTTLTGAGGTIQQWQHGKMDELHTAAKVTHALSGNLPVSAGNTVVIEINVTEAIAAEAKADNWMLVTFPLALNGSYKLGTTSLTDNSLNVTASLSNAALSSDIKTVSRGQSYTNTVTANAGYEISKVTVTMGGVAVANAYDATTGKITIAAVTGHLNIQVETVAADTTNLLVNGSFNQGTTGWAKNNVTPAATIANGVMTLSTATSSGDARTYNEMKLAPGTYQLTFDAKGTPGQYRPYVGVSKNYWTNDYGQYFLYNYPINNSTFTTITGTFTVPASAADANTGLAPVFVTVWNSNTAYAPVTEMQLDNFTVRRLVNVTASLSNATLSADIKTLLHGYSYTNTVTANAGYEISKVTVTMGGTEVANAYDAATGKITLSAVTGDLNIKVETVKLLNVTATLSNAALSADIKTVSKGQSYTNTVTASAGYEISRVTVTMGGAEVTNVYDATTGKITIAAVNGDLNIKVETVAIDSNNLLANGSFNQGATGWTNNGIAPAATIADGVMTLSTGKTSSGDARTYNEMKLAPGTYQLTFDAKGTPGQYRPYVGVSKNYWTNDYGQYFLYNYNLNDSTFTTITETFTVPASAADPNTGLAPVFVTVWNSNTAYAPVTEMQLDNFTVRRLLNVTTELNNATLSADIKTVAQGQSYVNTVAAKAGYEIYKVTVTMGGAEVANAYDAATGKITIAAVTGDLSIQVKTYEVDTTNLMANGNFDQDASNWAKNAATPAATIANGVMTLSTGKASGDARTYNEMQLAPGTYQLTFDAKGTPGQYRPYVGVSKNYWTNDYGQYFLYKYPLSNTEFTTITGTFTVPASAADPNTGLAPVFVTVWSSNSSYAPATEMQLDNFAVRKLVNVTTSLSNAALSADIKTVLHGRSYENTVTANVGYEITKVTVTMGGTEVANAYDAATGKIAIGEVTGDLNIQVEASATSLLINGSFDYGNAAWASNAIAPAATIANGVMTLPTEKTVSGDARTYNEMKLAPGTYQLSFDVKGVPAEYRPYVGVSKNYWTNDYGQYFMYNYNLSDSQWTTIKETFTVPASAADPNTGLAPVYVTVWNSNSNYAPVSEMQFDNFDVRKCFDVTVQNAIGRPATGLADYVLPNAVTGAPFTLTLTPETSEYKMTVSCTMGGVNVPVTVNSNGSVTIRIPEVSGDIVITAESAKSAYTVTNGTGIVNSNSATSLAHGTVYNANISSSDPIKKLYSITCTMGRETITVPVVNGTAAINIDYVTGDIAIDAILVDKNTVAHWIFDAPGTVKGFGSWGDAAQTVSIAHNGYYDNKNHDNNRANYTANVSADQLRITTNLPTAAAGWADASTVIGYKLPVDLELGSTYIMNLPIHAGNLITSLASSRNKSTRSGMELVFTTVKPENMWNASDKTVTRIYAEGAGIKAASTSSPGNLTTDSSNVFSISFKVTKEIKEYALAGNYLALIINHQHKNGDYRIGNATLTKVTDPAYVTFKIGNSICDGSRVAQKGNPYTAQIVPKAGYDLVYAAYSVGGGEPVEIRVVDNTARIKIDNVTGNIVITAATWKKSTGKKATKLPILGARPSPSPYNDYPYICDEEDNLMPNFSFESKTNYLENTYSRIEADENAWEGNYSLHYAPVATGKDAENLLINGDFADWNAKKKSIDSWLFNNHSKLNKIEFVELDGRHAVKLLKCDSKDEFNMELMQRVYLEADFTYTFSFDFYGVANWGPNLVIYDANLKNISTTNAKTTGKEGEWTTLSTTYRPTISGYYFFSARIHNAAYPQTEQYVSNCSVSLKSTRVEHELWNLKPNTNYWLTLFVKAAKVESVENSFITFGLTVPETGNFIVMADPSSEGGRPYKTSQQLVPMAYDGQWHVLTVPFNTCDATRLNFTIDGLNCEAWFDNIYIFEDADAKPFVSPLTDKAAAAVTDTNPKLLGCEDNKNLFENHDLNDGSAFWGEDSHRFGLFGNVLNVADSGSRVYGNALRYMSVRPTSTYYIKWIDVEPNTEYTFSAKYAIAQAGDGFMGLINGYRMESEVTENRLFPTMITQFGFGEENYLESLAWQTAAVSFNSGERNRIGFVICDAGGEAYIDELRLFKSSDGIALEDTEDTLPKGQNSAASKSAPVRPAAQQTDALNGAGGVMLTMTGALMAAAMVILMIIQKKRKNTQ